MTRILSIGRYPHERKTVDSLLIFTFVPYELLVERARRLELRDEERQLSRRRRLGVLLRRGEIEDQVCDNESLARNMEPRDVFLAEAGEVAEKGVNSIRRNDHVIGRAARTKRGSMRSRCQPLAPEGGVGGHTSDSKP